MVIVIVVERMVLKYSRYDDENIDDNDIDDNILT